MLEFLTTSRVRSNLFGNNKVPDPSSSGEIVDSSTTWTSPRKTSMMMMKSRASKSLASPKSTCKSSNQQEEKQEDVINFGEFVVLCRAVVIKEFTPSPYDQNSLSLKVILYTYIGLSGNDEINYISQRQFN